MFRPNQLIIFGLILIFFSCSNENNINSNSNGVDIPISFPEVLDIDFNNLFNYSNQYIPAYITKDNTLNSNPITNKGATLGRILFYDKLLSSNNSIACASCHKQSIAFSDNVSVSIGVNGETGRHSMRLINSRFSDESRFFWDERASTLEQQTTMPIQDHIEMGFSGENEDGTFDDLISKLENTNYYPELFNFAFGDDSITEEKIQIALSQFIKSIQSFDSKFDTGRSAANNDIQPFNNFTAEENFGKQLFFTPPEFNNQGQRINGGLGCVGCHQAPEFSIDPNSLNNGVIGIANNISGTDLTNTKSPTLRDVIKSDGTANGPFMHIGISNNIQTVINHYNQITINQNLDPRLMPGGVGQQLNITPEEKNAIIAFIKTLAGSDVYINEKWSNPFIN